jgi:Flp pilus assembly protein TadB
VLCFCFVCLKNKTKKQQRKILVTLDTQDTGGRQTKQNTPKRDTGNTRHTRYRRKTNKTKIHHREILVTLDTQDTGGRQTKQKYPVSCVCSVTSISLCCIFVLFIFLLYLVCLVLPVSLFVVFFVLFVFLLYLVCKRQTKQKYNKERHW